MGIFWLPFVVQAVAWGVHLLGSAWTNATLALATAFAGQVILVVILHPQRMGRPGVAAVLCDEGRERVEEEGDVADGEGEADAAVKLPAEYIDKVERQVRDAVERDRMYLNPDLTKAMLASRLGVNGLYLHIVLRQRFGPFNKYVNTLRMKHAMRYEREHPGVKREELALRSGFGSVRTYYRCRAKNSVGRDEDADRNG